MIDYKPKSALARTIADLAEYPSANDAQARAVDELIEACEPLIADLMACRPILPAMERRLTVAANALRKARGST